MHACGQVCGRHERRPRAARHTERVHRLLRAKWSAMALPRRAAPRRRCGSAPHGCSTAQSNHVGSLSAVGAARRRRRPGSPVVLRYVGLSVIGRLGCGTLCTGSGAMLWPADETLAEEEAYEKARAGYRPRGLFLNLAPVTTKVSFKRMASLPPFSQRFTAGGPRRRKRAHAK
jgi:hypothetical protein